MCRTNEDIHLLGEVTNNSIHTQTILAAIIYSGMSVILLKLKLKLSKNAALFVRRFFNVN